MFTDQGLICPHCQNRIQIPVLLTEWVSKHDKTVGCKIVGINVNSNVVKVQSFQDKGQTRHYDLHVELMLSFDELWSKYQLEPS